MEAVTNNPVGFLQEISLKYENSAFPKYIMVDSYGPSHSMTFKIKCVYANRSIVVRGPSKKLAKIEAASQMIQMLMSEGYFQSKNLVVDVNSLKVENMALRPPPKKNPISYLQEHCQKNNFKLPSYSSSNDPPFICTCEVNGKRSVALDKNKQKAKTEAAYTMCVQLGLLSEAANCMSSAVHNTSWLEAKPDQLMELSLAIRDQLVKTQDTNRRFLLLAALDMINSVNKNMSPQLSTFYVEQLGSGWREIASSHLELLVPSKFPAIRN